MDLVVDVYRVSALFPASERWRLVDQFSRSVVSVPANIAEGQGRGTSKDFAQFLAIARGSLDETETFLLLAVRLGYLTTVRAEPVSTIPYSLPHRYTDRACDGRIARTGGRATCRDTW